MCGNGKYITYGCVAVQPVSFDYVREALAANTLRVYENDWKLTPTELEAATVFTCAAAQPK